MYKADIATTHEDVDRDKFSDEALKDMAEATQRGELPKPIHFEFDERFKMGDITELNVEEDRLVGKVKLDRPLEHLNEFYVVPRFIIEESEEIDGVRIIKKANLLSFALTRNPADEHLTPIK